MEIRSTLPAGESFIDLLRKLQQDGTNASMIIDYDGLVRAEGIVTEVNTEAKRPYITLASGAKIEVTSIAAVNGVFLPEYSEC
ncbi:MAG: hypothetical protein JNK79_07365 [Chitinophagaceae bacterium]|nr:hypothetical protein [Chitinophagaceae bacterium]